MTKYFAILISLLPINLIRIFLYRNLLKYDIDYNSKISMFNYIKCNTFNARCIQINFFNRICVSNFQAEENVTIGKYNSFFFVKRIEIGSDAIINSSNQFIGTRNFFTPFSDTFYLKLGIKSIITSHHYFDCAENIIIGDNVVIGGRNSEIWTHGFDSKRTMILGSVNIGNNIYIGSNSKILQGTSICDDVSIGAGTIVSKNITESGFYVSSQLIRKADNADYSNNPNTIDYEGAKFYRK